MKLVKSAIALSMLLALANTAFAIEDISHAPMYQVPFYKVTINGGKKIVADYAFDSHAQVLVCKKESGDAIETVSWEYKVAKYIGQLPLTLKDDEAFEGQWADPDGKLVIKNLSDDNDSITVTCEYQNKK